MAKIRTCVDCGQDFDYSSRTGAVRCLPCSGRWREERVEEQRLHDEKQGIPPAVTKKQFPSEAVRDIINQEREVCGELCLRMQSEVHGMPEEAALKRLAELRSEHWGDRKVGGSFCLTSQLNPIRRLSDGLGVGTHGRRGRAG